MDSVKCMEKYFSLKSVFGFLYCLSLQYQNFQLGFYSKIQGWIMEISEISSIVFLKLGTVLGVFGICFARDIYQLIAPMWSNI